MADPLPPAPADSPLPTSSSPGGLPALTVTLAQPSDYPTLARLQREAFASDAMMAYVNELVDPVELEAHHVQTMEALPKHRKLIVARRGGQMGGFALWEFPLLPGEERREEEKPRTFPRGARTEEIVEFRRQYADEEMARQPRFVLAGLAVHPSFRRQGIAQALVNWGLTQIDALGLPAYLQSSTEAIPVYTKAGFVPYRPTIRGGPQDLFAALPMRRDPPAITIERATKADMKAFGFLQRKAFEKELFDRLVFAAVDPLDLEEWFAGRMDDLLPFRDTFVARRGEAVLGFASWADPKRDLVEEKKLVMRVLKGAQFELAADSVGRLNALDKSLTETRWHLMMLMIAPTAQGTGVGRRLIEWGAARADMEGLPIYLKSSDIAREFYKRFGFEQYHDAIRGGPDQQLRLTPMRRTASPLVIESATETDCPAFGHLQRVAFADAAWNRLTFANVPDDRMDAHFSSEFLDRINLRKAFVARRGGKVVGMSMWIPPRAESDPPPAWIPDRFCEGSTPEVLQPFFDSMDLGIKERHWYLEYLVVHPSAQGTGVGSELIKWGIEQSERDEVPIYLKSSVGGRKIYDKFGFEQWHETIYGGPGDAVSVCPMVRRGGEKATAA